MSKLEIEKELEGKGDFVQIDHLTRFLEQDPPYDIKKFVYLKLAGLYEKRDMFNDAAKMYEKIGSLSIPFSEKVKHHVKETELYIKAGFFDKADYALKKALSYANPHSGEIAEINFAVKDFYKRQAEVYEKERRRAHAVRVYEKLISMKLSETEKEEIKKKLLELYEKLGKIKEYNLLKGKF